MTERDLVSPEEIAAFIDGRLSGEARQHLEARLASNPEARQELIEASRIAASVPPAVERRKMWMPFAGVAAAAAVIFLVFRPGEQRVAPTRVSAERRGAIEEAQSIRVVAPAAGAALQQENRAFVWHGIEGASYRLVVSDETGRILLRTTTSDTSVAIPPSIINRAAGTYYWAVDALAPDGSSATSGNQPFVLPRR